jgi:murein DD-endopeptidase MepM/ murein hydrolase activator NlpD
MGRRVVSRILIVAVVLLAVGTPVAVPLVSGAATDSGAGPARPERVAVPRTGSPVGPSTYRPPLDRPVVDPFRAPAGPYGPGNRGLEYASVPGDLVRAIGPGVVVFAGPVAGRGVVSVVHPDGLRSSLTGLVGVAVSVGQVVATGTPVGRAGPGLHLGVRRDGRYIDPATLFGLDPPRHAKLVPVPLGAAGSG